VEIGIVASLLDTQLTAIKQQKKKKISKGLKKTAETYNIHENYGIEGLLGQYLLNKYLNKNKFNVDLGRKRVQYSPNEDWDFYARDDSPRYGGLEIGANYHF
jgi:hypothetical protein